MSPASGQIDDDEFIREVRERRAQLDKPLAGH